MTTHILLSVLAVLFGADVFLTASLLKKPGFSEANPIERAAISMFGLNYGLVISKGAVLFLICWNLDAMPAWALPVLVALYVGIVAWNARLYWRAQK